ncbi:MAG: LPS export ABC transporter permease LptF [Deferrisomatales bacterium]|nr:LPS export ABC transporter permease LptF [Deferrisomatales bacterium]
MRILNRYILTECLPTLGLSLVVFTFVLLMHRLIKLSDLVIAKGVPLGQVLGLLALALPALVPLLLPVSLLLAVLLAMGRLSGDSEIVAMRACGVGLRENLLPVMALSVAVCAGTGAVSLWLQPAAARSLQAALYDAVRNRISVTTEAGVFTEIASGVTVYAEGMDEETGRLENLFLHLERPQTEGLWVLARVGRLRDEGGALGLELEDGEMHQGSGPDRPYHRLRFDRYRLRIPLPGAAWSPDEGEAPTAELLALAYGPEPSRRARLELHQRLALPASCLVFGLLGATLGLHHSRAGRSRGVSLCLGVLLVYYAVFTAGRTLGRGGVLPPELAMWLPNLLLGTLAVYAYLRKSREAPLPLEEAAGRWLGNLRRALAGAHNG